VGLDHGTLGSGPEPEADTYQLSHPGALRHTCLKKAMAQSDKGFSG